MKKRVLNRLNYLKVKSAKPGIHCDGYGLELVVDESGARRWRLRLSVKGRRREYGLGGWPDTSLEAAREEATKYRAIAKSGVDPREALRNTAIGGATFEQVFRSYFRDKAPTLSNGKHVAQWVSTMETYVFPTIGQKPVADIGAGDVLEVLRPIWRTKPETARRVLQSMQRVFQAAILEGITSKASPCIGVADRLGPNTATRRHHTALPYGEVPGFIAALRETGAYPFTKYAFEFLILTAARSGEVRNARWGEVDFAIKVWTIPAERMKSRRGHVVPLSGRALEILNLAFGSTPKAADDLIFPSFIGRRAPGARARTISDVTMTKLARSLGYADRATVHGFRSSFRDWATEVAKAREVVAEAALAHAVVDKTEAAYRRAAYLDERRHLMQAWADFIQVEDKSWGDCIDGEVCEQVE